MSVLFCKAVSEINIYRMFREYIASFFGRKFLNKSILQLQKSTRKQRENPLATSQRRHNSRTPRTIVNIQR